MYGEIDIPYESPVLNRVEPANSKLTSPHFIRKNMDSELPF